MNRKMVLGVIALVGAGILLLVWTKEVEQLIQTFTHDDSFYYLQTARNAATGEGLTFDGRNPTNGFHPLWMLLLVPILGLLGGDPEMGLRAVLTFQVVVFLLPSLFLAYAATARGAGPWGGGAGLAAAIWLLPTRQVNAMESGVLILLGLALLNLMSARDVHSAAASVRDRLLVGALLGLLFLARTDSLFLILAWGTVAGVLWVHDGRDQRSLWRALVTFPAQILPVALPVLALATPYLAWNLQTHGRLMPVSGALKSSLPELVFSPHYLDLGTLLTVGLIAAALLWNAPQVLYRRSAPGRLAPPLARTLAVFGVYVLLHAAFTLFAMDWAVFPWHFALYAVPATVAAAAAARAAEGFAARSAAASLPRGWARSGWARSALALLLCAAVARSAWAFRDRPLTAFYVGSYRAAVAVRTLLPHDARLAMKDAGAFGYFSGRSVTNLDGVINNFSYQDYLSRGALNDYLREQGISYVAQHALWEFPGAAAPGYGSIELAIESKLFEKPGGKMRLAEEDEVYRAPSIDSRGATNFVIWRYRP